jgi:hypothetical protein
MIEATSKKIFMIELIVLALPITALFAYYGFIAVFISFQSSTSWSPVNTIGPIFLVGSCLYAFWNLAFIFIRHGAGAVAKQNGFIWAFLIIGIIYSVLGILPVVATLTGNGSLVIFFSFLRFGSFGLLLVPPALHLLKEYKRGTIANTSW